MFEMSIKLARELCLDNVKRTIALMNVLRAIHVASSCNARVLKMELNRV
jgi:hypothetical protein